jgi:hypothetical protein
MNTISVKENTLDNGGNNIIQDFIKYKPDLLLCNFYLIVVCTSLSIATYSYITEQLYNNSHNQTICD